MPHFCKGANEVADHTVEESIPIKGEFQNSIFLSKQANGPDPSDGGFAFVAWVGGKGGEVPFSREMFGGFSHGREIEGAGNVPRASDFEGVVRVGVGNPIKVDFPLGGEAGVESGFFASNGEDPNAGGEMKI